MIKPNQYVTVKWNSMNIAYYKEKGYEYTAKGDEFQVAVEDLQPSARIKIVVICDYCGKEFEMYKYAYTRSLKGRTTVACNDCKLLKTKETMLANYGVDNSFKLPETHIKSIATLKERYGVTSPTQLPKFKIAMQNYDKEIAQEHYIQTCVKKYGVTNTGKLDSSIQKGKETCLKKYGGESSQCDPEVHKKTIETLLAGGSIPSSKPERALVDRLKELYGEENCIPQYNFSRFAFDCLLTINDIQIDVEYDGIYWHNRKANTDRKRDYYVLNRGIKVLRFRGEQEVPTDELIKKSVDYLVNSEHHRLIVNIKDEDIV